MEDTSDIFKEGKFHFVTSRDEVKWLTSHDYGFDIPDEFYDHARLKRWCDEECEDVVAFLTQEIQFMIEEHIFFYSETDAMAFKLRWL